VSEINDLVEKLKREGERFASFFDGLTADQWKTEVYTEGSRWTIRSVLSHFYTSERAFVRLFANIRDGGSGVSEDFSIDRYNASQQEHTKELSAQSLLEKYKAVRADMIAFVSNLTEPELEKTGRHPFLGVTTLREMIKMVYIHNQIHYRDLKKVLR